MSGVTKDGVLQTDEVGGGGSSTSVAIGQPINATDAVVLNSDPVGNEYGVGVRVIGAVVADATGSDVGILDGFDINAGATTDAAVITDTNGTLSGKLRGLVKWAFERMPTSLGQKLMAASFPVVISSDQSILDVNATGSVISIGNTPSVVLSDTAQRLVRLDEASSTITYVGYAGITSLPSAAVWRIKRLNSTTGLVVEYANGTSAFNNIWNDRAILPYS